MLTQTPSQIAEQYVLSSYPCLNNWVLFVQNAYPNLLAYTPAACSQVASICNAAMKTIEYIQQNESNAKVVRVMRRLNDLYEVAWKGWTAFRSQAAISTGNQVLGTTPEVLLGITQFQQWDSALVQVPPFSPPDTLNAMLGGATP